MRLFISYARFDRPFCRRIVELLKFHETWYDERLYVGQKWWEIILEQLNLCEGFIFLISPASVRSEYCMKEYELALLKGKPIFPIIIEKMQNIPQSVLALHCIDMSNGKINDRSPDLLNAILVEERQLWAHPSRIPPEQLRQEANLTQPHFNEASFVDEAITAVEMQDYDLAIYLLRYAKAHGIVAESTVNLESLLSFAEAELEKRSEEAAAERDYKGILSLVRRDHSRKLGCIAFKAFREKYPHYDPKGISAMCSRLTLPELLWCDVPEGETVMDQDNRRVNYWVDAFRMSKHPITNAQFDAFINASDGYSDDRWWNFSREAIQWRTHYKEPMSQINEFPDHPRVNVSWYEAMAYCRWLSHKTGLQVTLPSEQQWQRAAQGDDRRQYPWGNRFDKNFCNARESQHKRTTNVHRFVQGASPYGILDMAGNVWEWCRNMQRDKRSSNLNRAFPERAIRGGSYSSAFKRVRNNHRVYLKPIARYGTIGFRVVAAVE